MRRFKTAASLTALCTAMGVGMGACAVDLTPRPQYPAPAIVTERAAPEPAPAPAPAPAAAAPTSDDGAPKAVPSTPVQSQSLPPPPGAKAAPPRRGSALEPRYQGAVEVLMFAVEDGVTVGKGDTLQKIAGKAGVSIEDLAKANKIAPPYKVKIGQKLVLPDADPEPPLRGARGKAGKTAAKAEAPESVTVGKGDTLQKIARAHDLSVEALAKANGLEPPYRVKAGQKLALSAPAEPAPLAASGSARGEARAETRRTSSTVETVKVAKGQTLQAIAKDAGVPVAELARLNGLKKPYRVRAGQTIKLPSGDDQVEALARSSAPAAAPARIVTVGKGQTLQSIADKAGVSVADLARLNGLKKPYRVKRGQRILIVAASEASESAAAPSAGAARVGPPRSTKAGRGETLQQIAEREDVSVAELARLNKLKKPYRLKRGQTIKLPGRLIAAAPSPSASSYQVQRGDTLFSIARRFNTDPKTLADSNGLEVGAQLNVGRRLQLPGGPLDRPLPDAARGRTPAAPVPFSSLPANPGSPPPPVQPPAPSLPPGPAQPAFRANPAPPSSPVAPPASAPEAATDDASVAAAGKGFFQWPARGQILSAYGPKSGGQRNDGLDISAPAGEAVRAAAGGEVVYAGNSVPGFGNLVLIRHDGGWVTAYAHLANIDVKMRQTVTQGQQIGEVGATGGVDQTQVHFEVRYAPSLKDKARPIDPALVLPER